VFAGPGDPDVEQPALLLDLLGILLRVDDRQRALDQAGEIFERLRAWRSSTAQAASVPAYVVFTDATLQAIAETRPTSVRELSALPGVGARKLEMYGADVLATIEA